MVSIFVDSHVHLWKLSRGDYEWIKPDNQILYQDYLPLDLEQHQNGIQVDGVVAVQAAHTVEETEYLLRIAERHPLIKGVIGWLDITSEQFPYLYESLQSNKLFKGIRYTLNHADTSNWEINSVVIRNLQLLERDGLVLDLLIVSENIPYVVRLLKHLPKLKVTVNHLGVPNIKEQRIEPWKGMMKEISEHPEAACKLSGMITLGKDCGPLSFDPYISHLFDVFGVDRLMFGSDWPVCLLGGSYQQVVELFRSVLPESLDMKQIHKLCRENAIRHYQLTE